MRGSALNGSAQEQFNDLGRCRRSQKKKKQERVTSSLPICSGHLTQSYMIASGLMGTLVQPNVLETFGNSGGNS
jgi:hypothetical protein